MSEHTANCTCYDCTNKTSYDATGQYAPHVADDRRRLAIDRPCSACSAGDVEMKHHLHSPPFREGVAEEPTPEQTVKLPLVLTSHLHQAAKEFASLEPLIREALASRDRELAELRAQLAELIKQRDFEWDERKRWRGKCFAAESQLAAAREALENLFALVKGEAPSLLEDDHHYDMVVAALEGSAPVAEAHNAPQLCANCGKPYGEHLLHDGNKCHLGSITGWFPKSVADAIESRAAGTAKPQP